MTAIVDSALAGDVARGYSELANRLQVELGCDQLLLGIRCGVARKLRLQAASGIGNFKRDSQLAILADDFFSETLLRDGPTIYDRSAPNPMATDAQKQLTSLCQAGVVVSGPIRNRAGNSIGAWAAFRGDHRNSVQNSQWAAWMRDGGEIVASRLQPCLELLQQCRTRLPQRVLKYALGADARRRRNAILAAMAGLICIMALPFPYLVKCDCDLQPATRRYVSVPFDGVIHHVFVEPGDFVREGQVLAKMDDREIALELAALHSDYEQTKKQYEVELAGQHTAAAQVAKLEMNRLEKKIELLQNRASNLDIRSPVDGVVIRGDAKMKEDARLRMGDGLFEIGPLDQMAVRLFVPDEEIAHVRPEQTVDIRLDASPGSPRSGTIRRVHPQAELHRQQNIFVAEVELENDRGSLRPGMVGQAKIRTAARPLAWNLFHKAWDRLVFLVAW